MISILGKFSILLSITSGMLYIIIPSGKTKSYFSSSVFYLQFLSIIVAFLSLLYAFITDDFSVQNVFFYSSTKQPFIYKIASLWGNHDASLLFFVTLLAIIGFISSFYINIPISMKVMSIIITAFMVIIYFTSNPFFHLSTIPIEGMGMNPVLQDMAIAIHPPILYLGYVTYAVPYIASIGILISKNEADTQKLFKIAYFSSKLAFGFLTVGISLGSWWAYRELGWGGYWFFDPVENVSLIPWLVGLALHHSFTITKRNGKLFSLTIALCLSNFLLILLGILLVRSGALVSVHSFAAGIIGGKYIISAFLFLIASTYIIYFVKIKSPISQNFSFNEKAIISGNVLIAAAAISLMIGTFFPILYQLVKGTNISISNQYFYYSFIPLASVIVLMASITPHLQKNFKFILYTKNAAMILSHVGMIILTVGITLNVYMKYDIEFVGKIGTTIKHNNITITLKNIKYSRGPNYYRQIGEFWIEEGQDIIILKPENRLYNIENAISAESDIYSFVTKDLYAVLGSIEDDGTLHANIYIRPWMSLIWLGMFLTAAGIFVSAARNEKAK